MKERKKRYDFKRSVLILLLLVVFLIIATYAWFTANKLVKVNSLDVTVQASEGFQISLDGINWKSVIQAPDIIGSLVNTTYAANVNHVPGEMVPVSTATLTDALTGFMDMFLGGVTTDDVTGEYVISASKIDEQAGTAGGFIAFDLFFKTNNDIYLALETEANVKDIGAGTRANKGMENAARIAFVNQGYISSDTLDPNYIANPTAGQIQGLKQVAVQDGSNVKIWEPNYKSHTDLAKTEVFNMFGILTSDTVWSDRIAYDGVYDEIDALSPVLLIENNETDQPNYFQGIPSTRFVTTEKTRIASTQTGIILKAGITKIRIYMWLEGQDYDCRR